MMALTTAETWEGGARPAYPHELCTCGRRGEIGYCSVKAACESRGLHPIGSISVEDSSSVLPCPFCGTDEPHLVVCPDYRVRPGGVS
jgi:hypothetical protein